MCTCVGIQALLRTAVVLMISTVVARASSYMRVHGIKASELWPHFRNTCNLTCPYGYQTDVEGNFVCQCHDPCKNVLCFWRTECVVELPKACTGIYCRPKATCREVSESSHPPLLQHGVPQADDAATTSSEASYPPRCLLPVSSEAKKCRKIRVRWYFDSVTGACEQFHGCRTKGTKGNNFKRRRGCEKNCLGIKTVSSQAPPRHVSSHPQRDDSNLMISGDRVKAKVRLTIPASCLVPPIPVTTGCRKVRKRWFFDSSSGSCRKFRSCPTAGNNFRKRRHCKNRCLRLAKTTRRKGRRTASRSAKQ